jgi:nuclear cap-binding protein subunit 2
MSLELSPEEYKERLRLSTTLYVGNLSFYTNECQLLEFFGQCGQVVNLIMGLNKVQKTPCGFCFVEYDTKAEAEDTVDCLNLQTIDGRQVRIDWDPGFKFGRQFGRGRGGG